MHRSGDERPEEELTTRGSSNVEIVYNSYGGRFSDSPRAVYEALVARGDDVRHTWLCAPEHAAAFPPGVRTVTPGTPESRAALEAADVLVANYGTERGWRKKPGAVYLQVWHGTPLKRIHNDALTMPDGPLSDDDHDVRSWDHMISPNSAATEPLRNAFRFTGPVHETGYPRNDALNAPDREERRAKVRQELGIPEGKRAVLYAPTWRDDVVDEQGRRDFDLHLDLGRFSERLGGDHVLLLRLHYFLSGRLGEVRVPGVLDVSSYPDIADLYLAADVLVTDYSSAMFDFAVTAKPIVYFTYDLAHYRDELRGFYFDLEEIAPGPLCSTGEEVYDALADLDAVSRRYAQRYARFREMFCHLEDGCSTQRVLELFFPQSPASGPEDVSSLCGTASWAAAG
ncbi:CDP-glycerol glycerophosphotransferase family protein [Kineococcus xinjiangensis]|uniref:CDP-glycerol glycerophosphotransferase family protein n=1 Tax=Kineococcus xinjiangensis TaxID=512762 RepID=UPI001FE6B3E3|nr:CDP-glycerol glycerophosphotransferase family protein [Kineococcus xinjiangensis]